MRLLWNAIARILCDCNFLHPLGAQQFHVAWYPSLPCYYVAITNSLACSDVSISGNQNLRGLSSQLSDWWLKHSPSGGWLSNGMCFIFLRSPQSPVITAYLQHLCINWTLYRLMKVDNLLFTTVWLPAPIGDAIVPCIKLPTVMRSFNASILTPCNSKLLVRSYSISPAFIISPTQIVNLDGVYI